jgi:hypothetical protein
MPTVEDIGPDGEIVDNPISNVSQDRSEPGIELEPLSMPGMPMPMGLMMGASDSPAGAEEEEDDEDYDETLVERLMALTEMLPEGLRSATSSLTSFSFNQSKKFYGLGRAATWVIFTSAFVLGLPIVVESSFSQSEENTMQAQREVLLGPGQQPQ